MLPGAQQRAISVPGVEGKVEITGDGEQATVRVQPRRPPPSRGLSPG
ncbi:hypothetical protein ACGFJ7_43410 [Actinoplanes sp. NPDC048988]